MYDEGPSEEDLRRFGSEADAGGYCPACAAEIYDDLDECPRCGEWIDGVRSRPSTERAVRQRFTAVIVILLVLVLSGVLAITRIF